MCKRDKTADVLRYWEGRHSGVYHALNLLEEGNLGL